MTNKQKQAIRILNSMHERKFADDEEYFLLLDFIVGQPQITYTPWTDPKPITWEKPFWDDGITCGESTIQDKSASSITESIKAKEDEMSYGDRLIKEGRSPL